MKEKLFKLDIKIESKNVTLLTKPQKDESRAQWVELRYTPTDEKFKKYAGEYLALITDTHYRCVRPLDRVEAE